jgi:hypothetical protein
MLCMSNTGALQMSSFFDVTTVHSPVEDELENVAYPSFRELLQGFLNRTGWPCPELADQIKAVAIPAVRLALDHVDELSFRIRHLLWAMTGANTFSLNSDISQVCTATTECNTRLTSI